MAKMNETDFLATVLEAHISDEVDEYIIARQAKRDADNAKRREKATSKKAAENDPLKAQIMEFLGTVGGATTAVVADKVGITTPKASPLLRDLVAEGKLTVKDVTVPKKGKQKSYSIVGEGEEA